MTTYRPVLERFHEKYRITENGCWEWTAATLPNGYSYFWPGNEVGRMVYAHRFSYEQFVEPIPEGLSIDHLCRNRSCVNPEHLEPVTTRENLMRGEGFVAENAVKTHCPQGHEYNDENTHVRKKNGWRQCRVCDRESKRVNND